jgi:hypothetical protein
MCAVRISGVLSLFNRWIGGFVQATVKGSGFDDCGKSTGGRFSLNFGSVNSQTRQAASSGDFAADIGYLGFEPAGTAQLVYQSHGTGTL